ncbi:MaoC family dehydratase N-terminal domain-containing protein [Nocardioides sp. NPDC101246]|uniref:MaoC family dehydratase N-terminal domain-containing protein n=1 Tax=Nocardioides sp. NPDC101246 TaxID=3364336 RepID=UPI0037F88F2B
MPVDPHAARALQIAPLTVEVERGRLRFFAKAIGETDAQYTDVEVARKHGHRDLPVPPTFFFSVDLERPDPFAYLDDLGVDLRHVLHGEQHFDYHAMAYAGDTLTLEARVLDVTSKRGGSMDVIRKRTDIRRGSERVATATSTIVVRYPKEER